MPPKEEDRHQGKPFTVRLSEDELTLLESLQERLQARAPVGVRITQRMTILAALERLQAHLGKLDRDKGRER